MIDNLKPEHRRHTMRAVKGKGTKLEICLFSTLVGMGLSGWTKNAENVIGKPDVVFARQKVAIFIDGCFWHGCPFCKRKLPETNHEYWERKISRNVELANHYNKQLLSDGWTIIRIWEHDFKNKIYKQEFKSKLRRVLSESDYK